MSQTSPAMQLAAPGGGGSLRQRELLRPDRDPDRLAGDDAPRRGRRRCRSRPAPSGPGPGRARPRPPAPRARSRRRGSRRRSGWSDTRTSRPACRAGPTRPSVMIAIRVETVIASSWSWVTMTKVRPRLSWMLTSSNWVCSRSFLSSAPSGSSSSSTFGRLMIARARATRCFCPPESWSGRRFSRPSSCTSRTASATRSLISLLAHAVLLEAEGDVVRHRHVREQRVGLEHHVGRPLPGRHRRHVLAVDQDPAGGRRLEAGEHPQQRGLAAARRAQQGEELALVDVEADIVDGVDVAELLGDVLDLDERLGARVLPGLDAVALVGARPRRDGGRFRASARSACSSPPLARLRSAAGHQLGPQPGQGALRLLVEGGDGEQVRPDLGRREQAGVGLHLLVDQRRRRPAPRWGR